MFHHQVGQTLVEFALVLPLFVLIIAGIFDLGRAFYASITITNAAREGARYGTLNPDYSQGMCNAALVEADLSGVVLSYSNVDISCNTTVTCLSTGTSSAGCSHKQPLKVTVNYNFTDMILGFFFPSGIYMERYVEMLVP
ncbi:MAG: hypothetical protein A2032_01530 [Chloroflexi bacterium RBG_19FT_COMBO_49_13]|nr:MAG: hypothetical protein A2032_01530 [Chloroflexi bacterium RBG_19FT_COMBO_49_13]